MALLGNNELKVACEDSKPLHCWLTGSSNVESEGNEQLIISDKLRHDWSFKATVLSAEAIKHFAIVTKHGPCTHLVLCQE